MAARTAADSVGARVAGNGWGEEAAGNQRASRAYIRPLGSARCPTPATQKRRRPRDTGGTPGRTSDPLAVHIVPRLPRKSGGDQGTLEGRQGVHPTAADGKWVRRIARTSADGVGAREWMGVAGNGRGEEAAGDERAWLRGRLRTGNGCGELRGRLRTACMGVLDHF